MDQRLSATRAAALVGKLPGARATYHELAGALRLAVADGRIPMGTVLPGERALAPALGVSRTTVSAAYGVLKEAGFVSATRGSGTVATLPVERRRRGTGALYPVEPRPDLIDLSCAATAAPPEVLQAYTGALEQLPAWLDGPGYLPVGVPELREQIAARYTEAGVPTGVENIVITSGSMAALSVVVGALVRPGTRVAVESVGYPTTLELVRRRFARLVPLPMDDDGWLVEDTISTLLHARPALALLIPDFHNPTGALMPTEVRERLARALRQSGTVAVVDETIRDVDLDRPAPMPPPFAAFAPGTITVGSASKSHWGGLRVGWLRVPQEMFAPMVEARATQDLGASLVGELAFSELLRAGWDLGVDRHASLVAARDATEKALRALVPEVSWMHPRGGLSLWLRLPDPLTAGDVAAACERAGLVLADGPRFAALGGLGSRLRLPYVLSPTVMEEAVRRLASSIESVRAGADRPRHAERSARVVA